MTPRRSNVLGSAILAVLLGCALAACEMRKAPRSAPPDVILIVVDSLRADRVRRALDGDGRMPNLARFAEDAVVYERATSPATWCVPAHAALFTGRWPSFHGAERRFRDGEEWVAPIDAEARTLAELLRERGMRTAAFVPGRTDLASTLGFDRGFDDWVDDARLAQSAGFVPAIARWLALRPGPVFLLVGIDDLRRAKVPAEGGGLQLVSRAELTNLRARHGGISDQERLELAESYDSGLEAVDRTIGELLGALQAEGRYADALIIVTADHGELLGEQNLVGHGWPPYEGAVNVPLIVKYPRGERAGERVDRRISALGIFATVLEQVDVPLPDGAQARPLDDRHPVWVEDVDRQGRRLRAGYDGLRKKIIRVTDGEQIDIACVYDMYNDAEERRPECGGPEGPLHGAMASFSQKPRPGQPSSGLARAGDERRNPPERPERAPN
ncbi:MAG TPA: sulfatase [Candidatus Binatia bacterium]